MSMLTTQGQLAAHLSAELAEQFARRHAERGAHSLASQNYMEACQLYRECGCIEYALAAAYAAQAEAELVPLLSFIPNPAELHSGKGQGR